MGAPSRRARRRPRYARIATACTRFFPPTMPSPRYTRPMFRRLAASATRKSQTRSCRAFTGRQLRGATNWLRYARTATGSTRSRRISTRILQCRNKTWRGPPARGATRECGFLRSLEWPAAGSRLTWTVITDWPRKAARWWWPTAPVATACMTFCHRAIHGLP